MPTMNVNTQPCNCRLPSGNPFSVFDVYPPSGHMEECIGQPILVPYSMPTSYSVRAFLPGRYLRTVAIDYDTGPLDGEVVGADIRELPHLLPAEVAAVDEVAGDFSEAVRKAVLVPHAQPCQCERCACFRAVAAMFAAEKASSMAWRCLPTCMQAPGAYQPDPEYMNPQATNASPSLRLLEHGLTVLVERVQAAFADKADTQRKAWEAEHCGELAVSGSERVGVHFTKREE